MDVVIAGGHGQVARHLTGLLVQRGDRVRGLIRDPAQADDLRLDGAEPVVLDLEATPAEALAEAIGGADAVVFAAGAGPGSGAPRKETVDYGAAIVLLHAAQLAAVERYVMISAIGAADPPDGDDVFSVYLRAKARADGELMASDRAWTIVRPGRLTDGPPTGRVHLARRVDRGEIPRADVAAVLAALLHERRTAGLVLELVGGETPVDAAVQALRDA
jgi:uncharacterized protein YbjT (DUF2867 family)